MKHQFLKIEPGKDFIEVPPIEALGFDIRYDFENGSIKEDDNGREVHYSSYFINQDLIDAVNAAIVTGRPLLLKGAPGCGKTKLAAAVAAQFHGKEFLRYYFEWHVKSRSKAKDGAYTFDHVNRLRDATVAKKPEEISYNRNTKNYLSLGPMGFAFRARPKKGKAVLLIDEIDKGDIDFPNDLLLELDEMRFAINELDVNERYVEADSNNRPLVIITSNDERELPPAFLRRCLFYRIPSFDEDRLHQIAQSKLAEYYKNFKIEKRSSKRLSDDQIKKVVERFIDERDSATGFKIPSTSEMLDWLQLIVYKINSEDDSLDSIINDEKLKNLALKLLK